MADTPACPRQHALVQVNGTLFACECPAVYRRQGKSYLDPQLRGVLDEILRLAGGMEGLRRLAAAQSRARRPGAAS
jgi:hypothetical protein